MEPVMMVGSFSVAGPVSALPGTAGGVEVAAGSAPSGDGDGAWLALVAVLCAEIGRLREVIEGQLGQGLPFPPGEVVAALRRLHDDARLAAVIERLVDL